MSSLSSVALQARSHGLTGYTTHGCRCPICHEANKAYARQWARDRRAGRPRTVPADETRRYLRKLMKAGHSAASISEISGMSDQAILKILARETKSVRVTTQDRILGVMINEKAGGSHLVSSRGARFLLDTMRAAGIPPGRIVAMLGYASSSSSVPTARNKRITYRNHRRIVVLYELMARAGMVDAIVLDKVM